MADRIAPRRDRAGVADLLAGVSIAGLLVPEAVAYSSLAGLPPAAGLSGLVAGLVCYAIVGRSRFAIVAATSSSAAFVGAATLAIAGPEPGRRIALAAGLVLVTGIVFLLAAATRLGSISNFISRPVLRGFAFGLAISIVIRQGAKMAGFHGSAVDTLPLLWQWLSSSTQWNHAGLALGLVALLALRALSRLHRVPGALLVVLAGIGAAQGLELQARGVELVGPIALARVMPSLPALSYEEWLRVGELALALLLLLFAESYGAIRSTAMRHGDAVLPNRDLVALGLANLVAGLFHGTAVGAGYSATSANEAGGAASRAAGVVAALTVLVLVAALLPWIERTPEPVLAAVVVSALWHALSPQVFGPYFQWRRDRVVVVAAALAVLVLGVLDGLLIGIAASLAMTLRDFAVPRLAELRRGASGHDFLSLATHPDLPALPGVLILRPETPLFFANVEPILAEVLRRVDDARPARLVLSLEETPDLDGTVMEALGEFVQNLKRRGVALVLARVKELPSALLRRAYPSGASGVTLVEGSVDDAVQ